MCRSVEWWVCVQETKAQVWVADSKTMQGMEQLIFFQKHDSNEMTETLPRIHAGIYSAQGAEMVTIKDDWILGHIQPYLSVSTNVEWDQYFDCKLLKDSYLYIMVAQYGGKKFHQHKQKELKPYRL